MENNKQSFKEPNTQVCQFFLQGKCKFGKKCMLKHQIQQITEDTQKICHQFQNGFCKFGIKCKYQHIKLQKLKKQQERARKDEEKYEVYSDEEPVQEDGNKLIHQKQENRNKQMIQKQEEGNKQINQMQYENKYINKQQDVNKQLNQQKNDENQISLNVIQKQLDEIQKESKFIDISKRESGKERWRENKKKVFEDMELFEFIKRKEIKKEEVGYYQLLRKYMNSFEIEDNKVKIFLSPSCNKKELGIEDIWKVDCFEVVINMDLQYVCTFRAIQYHDYQQHTPIPLNPFLLQKLAIKLQNFILIQGIFQAFKSFDNYFDQIIQKIHLEIQNFMQWHQQEQILLEKLLIQFKHLQPKELKLSSISTAMLIQNQNHNKFRTPFEIEHRINHCKQIIKQKKESSSEYEEKDDENEDQYDNCKNNNDKNDDQNENENDIQNENVIDNNIDVNEEVDKEIRQEFNIEINQQIYLQELEIKNIGSLTIDFLLILVICKQCKQECQLGLKKHPQSKQFLFNNLNCPKCNPNKTFQQSILFRNSIIHNYNSQLGTIGSYSWIIKDVLKFRLLLQCQQCDITLTVKDQLAQSGIPIYLKCAACFVQMQFAVQQVVISDLNTLSSIKSKANRNVNNNNNNNSIKNSKQQSFKVGQALPEEGSCKHYKHSYRYFRFPCCGKAYACDKCHDVQEQQKHIMEMARNVICGFCSYEQKVSSDNICTRCNSNMTKQGGGSHHWEGGKGCRNKNLLEKNDSKKYTGTCKTLSKKAQQNQK